MEFSTIHKNSRLLTSIKSCCIIIMEQLKMEKKTNKLTNFLYIKKLQRNINKGKSKSEKIKDKDLALYIVKTDREGYLKIPKKWQDDKDILLAAIECNAYQAQYFSKDILDDKEFSAEAIKKSPSYYQFLSDRLHEDTDLLLLAYDNPKNRASFCINYASETLKKDRELTKKILSKDGISLEYVDEEFKNDKELVLLAINENAMSLQYASPKLQNDKTVVLAAVKKNGNVYEFLPKTMKQNKEVACTAFKKANDKYWVYKSMPLLLQTDKDILDIYIKEKPGNLEHITEIPSNKNYALDLIKKDHRYFKYVSTDAYDKDFLSDVMIVNPKTMPYVKALTNDYFCEYIAQDAFKIYNEKLNKKIEKERAKTNESSQNLKKNNNTANNTQDKDGNIDNSENEME